MTEGEKMLSVLLGSKDVANLFLIKDDWLSKKEAKILRFIRNYTGKYDKLPPISLVNDDTGSELESIRGVPFDHTLQNVKKRFVYTELNEKVPDAMKVVKHDPFSVLGELNKIVENLGLEDAVSYDTFFHDSAGNRYDKYLEKVRTKGVTHLSAGHPLLDELFLGWGKTDLITLGGKPGSKKSWSALYLMLLAEKVLPKDAGPLMFISNEMNSEELIDRLDCMMFTLPYQDFLRGQLGRGDRKRYVDGLKNIELLRSKMLIIYGCNTLQELEHKVKRYRPSMIFADGSYLFEPEMEEGMAKAVYITRKLKQIALKGTPLLQTTQLRKSMGKKSSKTMYDAQEEFYYGSYIQDSDTAIKTFITPEMIYRETVGWELAKGRKVDPNTKLEFVCSLRTMKFDFIRGEDDEEDGDPSLLLTAPVKKGSINVTQEDD